MIKDKWDDRRAFITVDIVKKDGFGDNASSAASRVRCVSGVTHEHSAEGVTNEPRAEGVYHEHSAQANDAEGFGDTCSSPPPHTEQPIAIVDWNTITIEENPDEDGNATQLVDEDQVYEAMGFKQAKERDEKDQAEELPILAMSAEMQQDMVKQLLMLMTMLMLSHCMNETGTTLISVLEFSIQA